MVRAVNTDTWTELTAELPPAAQRGDRDAISEWLARWSQKEKVEAVVTIDLRTGEVRAGTVWSTKKVTLPGDLKARTRDENERIEVWHNHPRTSDAQTNSIPSADDVIAAMGAGVASVTVVDDYADRQVITRGAQPIDNGRAAQRWLHQAQIITEIAISATGLNVNRERAATKRAEIVVAAAHAVGMVELKDIDTKTAELGGRVAKAANEDVGRPTELNAKMKGEGKEALGHSVSTGQTERTQRWKTQPSTQWEW